MKTEKIFIKNRKGQKISVLVEIPEKPTGLAFVMHGLGGFKEQAHIELFAHCFTEKNMTTVRFDTTNTLGESDGNYEDATVTNYYADLEDVIAWAKKQSWYQEPFFLAGHSIGGLCAALYAEKKPAEVKGLAPISTVVSGKLSLEAHDKKELADWKKTGWQIKKSRSKPGMIKKLRWSHMEDRLKYDLLPNAKRLTMPVLFIVGEKDITTPAAQQEILFSALPGKKEIHIIKDAPHTFHDKKHLDEIRKIMLQWIGKI